MRANVVLNLTGDGARRLRPIMCGASVCIRHTTMTKANLLFYGINKRGGVALTLPLDVLISFDPYILLKISISS